jgi:predicted permease
MLKDLKHAARMLLQSRGWTAVVVVSLALGIGANTALFSAVNGLLLQTVGVPNPETLVRLKWYGKNDMIRNSSEYGFSQLYQGQNVRATTSYAMVQSLRAANQTLTDLAASAPFGQLNIVVNNQAEIGSGSIVSGNYFQVLQLSPYLGRLFVDADDKPNAPPVAAISHAYWRKRFASDPNVAGKTISINNVQVTVVGVTPPTFLGTQRLGDSAPAVFIPLVLDSSLGVGQTRMSEPTSWWLQMIGRLKPGVTLAQVKSNLDGPFQQTAKDGMASYMAALTPEQRQLSTNKREMANVPQLLALSGARGTYDLDNTAKGSAAYLAVVVVLVLLIVCANVANLLLSRATSRRKELSVRLSMGATRGRLIRQLLTESLLLAGLGGVLGVLVGYWSRQLLPFGQSTPIDWRVFAFVAGLSMLTGIVFGLIPAFRATRVDLASAMKETSRSVSATRGWLSRGLLVIQVALSLVLIIGAGLFLRTIQNLRSVDVGFNTHNLLMFSVSPGLNRYDADRSKQLYRDMTEALKAVPGVRTVGMTRTALLSGSESTSSFHVKTKDGDKEDGMFMMTVSPDFFATLEVPILFGRGFSDRDTMTSPKVGVINETAARKFYPDGPAVGRRGGFQLEKNEEFEIIGVIRDTKYNRLREAAPPTFYQTYLQQPNVPRMTFVVRTGPDPSSMIETVRSAMNRLDSNLPLINLTTQTDQIENRFAQERLFANASSLFGALALVLASIGLFGLMSYNVSRRTNEIGIRMALGARRFDVARMVLTESLMLVGIGLAIGLLVAILTGRFVAQNLFGLEPYDVATMALAIAVIAVVSTLAGYLPARRASRVDPMVALHHE